MTALSRVLIEVTKLTNNKLWSTNFNWDEGDLRVELRADEDSPDLLLNWQSSALLTDVTMNKRQITNGATNYRDVPRVTPAKSKYPRLHVYGRNLLTE